jgi:iron complex outermembrane receptor protein
MFLVFLLCETSLSAQNHILQGKITDNHQPLEGATVLMKGTSLGAISSGSGFYRIENIINKVAELTISLVGYQTKHVMIILNDSFTNFDISLETDQSVLNQVVVTGVSKATLIRQNPLSMISISTRQIEQVSADNVIDAIARLSPGFQVVKTGPNVSKPFINGLGYNRVLTLYDGMRVETQQWGDEHGVPMDDYMIEKAEIIKGPASLLYGSDAIAGVLSLFPFTPKMADGKLYGQFLTEYQSNNGLIGNNLRFSSANAHWSWSLSGSERIARNYSNPVDGSVYNTGFQMVNATGFLGYTGENGYSHFNVTYYDNRQGIPDGSRDSLSRKFTYQIYESPGENINRQNVDNIKERPVVPYNLLHSYSQSPLSQRIQDYRLYSDHFYRIAGGDIKVLLGFEQNIRREFNHPADPEQAGEYIVLNTVNYGIRYNAPAFKNAETTIGVNGMYQNNSNKNATDFPIPDYHLFDFGMYAYGKWKMNRWTIAGGVRFDHRHERMEEMFIRPNPATGFNHPVFFPDTAGSRQQFPSTQLSFQGVSGSIGFTYRISEQISLKSNIARGYRSPNITEIASNGLDPGAHIVYRGNLNFVPEFSLQEDLGISGQFSDLSFNFSIFNNDIRHYIYEDQEVDQQGNPVVIIPGNKTFQFQQTNAQLYGGDAWLNVHPHRWTGFQFENSFSLVYGYNRNPKFAKTGSLGEYLPFIPPPKWMSSISCTLHAGRKKSHDLTVKMMMEKDAAQNRYLGLNQTETFTEGYTIFDISVHTNIKYSKAQTMQVLLQLNNVFNTAYQSHLSRLQYFEYYTSSTSGRYGIYNMGRNLCLKMIFPF